MTTDRLRLAASLTVYGIMALGMVASIEQRAFGPMQTGAGLSSFLAGLVLLRRPDWSGRLLGRSAAFNLLGGLAFLGMAASFEHLVTGAAESVTVCLSIACLLTGLFLDHRARQRIPRSTL